MIKVLIEVRDSIYRKDGTAQGVAKQRLIETLAKPERRIISDPYADTFVLGSGIIKLMGHKLNIWLTQKFAPGFHEHLISRTRFIDDLVEKSTAEESKQYVILGAGYDLRAHRLNIPSSVKIFEVDQPDVQLRKRAKLPKKLQNVENITYVSVDFNRQTLKKQLLDAGFDQKKPTIFTLEGVSQYITKKAIQSTLNDLAELTLNTTAIFFISYVNKQLKENPKACFGKGYVDPEKKVEMIQRLAAKVGEPWISFYEAKEIENLLTPSGFSVIENKNLADLNGPYFSPVGRTLNENQIFKLEQFLVAKK